MTMWLPRLEGRRGPKYRVIADAIDEDVQNGALRPYINIFVNDEDIRFLQNLDTPLKDSDEVSIVPAIAGG